MNKIENYMECGKYLDMLIRTTSKRSKPGIRILKSLCEILYKFPYRTTKLKTNLLYLSCNTPVVDMTLVELYNFIYNGGNLVSISVREIFNPQTRETRFKTASTITPQLNHEQEIETYYYRVNMLVMKLSYFISQSETDTYNKFIEEMVESLNRYYITLPVEGKAIVLTDEFVKTLSANKLVKLFFSFRTNNRYMVEKQVLTSMEAEEIIIENILNNEDLKKQIQELEKKYQPNIIKPLAVKTVKNIITEDYYNKMVELPNIENTKV